jgi:multisubunit Na+/H+ antiporter MnhG subunit
MTQAPCTACLGLFAFSNVYSDMHKASLKRPF